MLTINVPVVDKIICVDVYINVDVQLYPKNAPQSPRETMAIGQLRHKLNGEIYATIKSAIESLQSSEVK